jgi:hypothetical protein
MATCLTDGDVSRALLEWDTIFKDSRLAGYEGSAGGTWPCLQQAPQGPHSARLRFSLRREGSRSRNGSFPLRQLVNEGQSGSISFSLDVLFFSRGNGQAPKEGISPAPSSPPSARFPFCCVRFLISCWQKGPATSTNFLLF